MFDMFKKIGKVLKKAFTPITIILIPHSSNRTIRLHLPSIGIIAIIAIWLVFSISALSAAVDRARYQGMKARLNYYAGQIKDIKGTVNTLKAAEAELVNLLSSKSRDKVLEKVSNEPEDMGSVDMDAIRKEVQERLKSVSEFKDYLRQQKDIYVSTPKGWPIDGRITSPFGYRTNPINGGPEFHSGVDIANLKGTPIRATADGIVSYEGWKGGDGRLVVLEDGYGYSTVYAHTSQNLVHTGQKIKRGDIIAYVGSTGNATGPHVHYEVWKDGKPTNPLPFIEAR